MVVQYHSNKFRRDWSQQNNKCKFQRGTGPGIRMSRRTSSVDMPHMLQKCYIKFAQLGKMSNSVIRSSSVAGSEIGVMSDQWRVPLYIVILQNVLKYSVKNSVLFEQIPAPIIAHR